MRTCPLWSAAALCGLIALSGVLWSAHHHKASLRAPEALKTAFRDQSAIPTPVMAAIKDHNEIYMETLLTASNEVDILIGPDDAVQVYETKLPDGNLWLLEHPRQ